MIPLHYLSGTDVLSAAQSHAMLAIRKLSFFKGLTLLAGDRKVSVTGRKSQ